VNTTWTADEIRAFGHQVVDAIADHLTTLPERPVFRPVPREAIDGFLHEPVPESGLAPEAVLAEFIKRIEPTHSAMASALLRLDQLTPRRHRHLRRGAGRGDEPECRGGNHAAVYVERAVIGWFRDLLGFPAESMGCWSAAARWRT